MILPNIVFANLELLSISKVYKTSIEIIRHGVWDLHIYP